MGLDDTRMVRLRAGVSYALTEAMDDGHCGLPKEQLRFGHQPRYAAFLTPSSPTFPHSSVEVQAGQYVLVAVTDSGTGMRPEVVAKAFDPFFTTKGPGKGTGLGLSQVFGLLNEYSRHVSWIELDQKLASGASDLARERVGPIGNIAEPDAVRPERSMSIRQERHPKRHSVFWHAQCERSFMFAPYGDGRAEQGAVNFFVVAPGDLPSQRALKFAEHHRRKMPRFVALAGCWVSEGRARIEMHPPHHCADQALNMPAIMRSAYGPKDQLDALFAARPCKSMAAKIGAIVRVHGSR
jgi:hypothetical protein